MMDHSDHTGMHGMTDDSSNMSDMNMGMSGDDSSFCTGDMGMVMYMEGFRWTLQGGHSCINLYFPGWTLDSRGKVIGAMIGVLILAMLTEGISKLRHELSLKARLVTTSQSSKRKIGVVQTILHGLHAFAGYIVMLATMTFSLEMLFSVVFGLVFGYVIFGGDSYSHVSTNPCCAFLEEEANEREMNVVVPERPDEVEVEQNGNCCENNSSGAADNTELNNSEASEAGENRSA